MNQCLFDGNINFDLKYSHEKNMFVMNSSSIKFHVSNISCIFRSSVKCSDGLGLCCMLVQEGVKKTLKWTLLTFPFVRGYSNRDKVSTRYVIYLCTKSQIDRTDCLGGVRKRQTDIHTNISRGIRIWIRIWIILSFSVNMCA